MQKSNCLFNKYYDYLILDAQYLLMRSFMYIKNNAKIYDELKDENGEVVYTENGSKLKYETYDWDILTEDEIIEKTIRSMINTVNKYKFGKLICVYDTSPYYNSDILMSEGGIKYKSDRQVMSEELINSSSDLSKKATNMSMYKAAEIRKSAKKKLRAHLERIGFSTMSQSGYEADFIANMLSDIIEETKPDSTALLVSNDTDWQYFVKNNVDFSDCNGNNIITKEEMLDKLCIPECRNKLFDNLFLYKAVHDSMYGNHNTLLKTVQDEFGEEDENELLNRINEENLNFFENIDLFKVQYKSFLYWTFPYYDDIIKKCKKNIENSMMTIISPKKYMEDPISGLDEKYYEKNIYMKNVQYY